MAYGLIIKDSAGNVTLDTSTFTVRESTYYASNSVTANLTVTIPNVTSNSVIQLVNIDNTSAIPNVNLDTSSGVLSIHASSSFNIGIRVLEL